MVRAHIYIYGDVTGVGYRAWCVRNAQELDLTGYVKNAGHGEVEALFEGDKQQILEMIERCHSGPDVAWVEKAIVKWEDATGEFAGFEMRY